MIHWVESYNRYTGQRRPLKFFHNIGNAQTYLDRTLADFTDYQRDTYSLEVISSPVEDDQ